MKKVIIFILWAGLWGSIQAQTLVNEGNTATDSSRTEDAGLKTVIAPENVKEALPVKKILDLGRHHISLSWYGFSTISSKDLNYSYLDASAGEGGFFNYRYSFSKHIDLAVDGRAHISDAHDDSFQYFIKSEIYHSGFGVRYNFNHHWHIFPYLQGNIYRTQFKLNSRSVHYIFQEPNAFWSSSGEEWSFGLNAGADIRLGKLISIPVDITYVNSTPNLDFTGEKVVVGTTLSPYESYIVNYSVKKKYDLSSYMISVGVSFNWGKIN